MQKPYEVAAHTSIIYIASIHRAQLASINEEVFLDSDGNSAFCLNVVAAYLARAPKDVQSHRRLRQS